MSSDVISTILGWLFIGGMIILICLGINKCSSNYSSNYEACESKCAPHAVAGASNTKCYCDLTKEAR